MNWKTEESYNKFTYFKLLKLPYTRLSLSTDCWRNSPYEKVAVTSWIFGQWLLGKAQRAPPRLHSYNRSPSLSLLTWSFSQQHNFLVTTLISASQTKGKLCKVPDGQENAGDWVATSFSFESDWCMFSGPITRQSKAKHKRSWVSNFYFQLKTTLY